MNELKLKVLSIKPTSRKNNYFNVTLENGDAYNLHEKSIIRYNIKENQSIENKIINQALNITEKEIIKNKIIVLLSYRQRSKKELKDIFLSKGYNIDNVLIVINKLEQRKYLDDKLFTKMMASHLIKEKKLGRYMVEQKLLHHGIDVSEMDPIVSDLYKKYPPLKKIPIRNTLKNKLKMINHLKRKGFHVDDINSIIESY
ncbi:RecX family transcriptional regulator [Candidatus Marinimicrobia bacterium]|nr:RecX family transcriptional regulator [Candidatus Neomarinimicrobiota bacterium]